MIKIKEAVIVEGKYDKIRLQSFLNATIIETNGFRIFKEKEKQILLRKISEKNGIIILTDSDKGGEQLRKFLKGILKQEQIKNCYVPQIFGKEKRKAVPSKAGFLGVEGIEKEEIINSLKKCGATFLGITEESENSNNKNYDNTLSNKATKTNKKLTKQDLFDMGLLGKENSAILRKKVLLHFGFPEYLSSKAFAEVINYLDCKENLIDFLDNT